MAEQPAQAQSTERTPCEYEQLDDIPQTSNIVERLFSSGHMVLCYVRNMIFSFTQEMILFLRVNDTFWVVTTVGACA
ncbi:hypothetical protein PPTG_21655 [Phytophthora nicotianae INRA-310]|uniref:Uncharacterized protein n=3 Tax=Phytophthora nicotianae TaxID=4792 RepID=W2QW63_PHYN3|nr:hypothetical protein PPTG_21655 [Phytophthora nicotianae INRA-310]ETN17462.1 hypothetical protein PPTG_21655 [Phytophthora nicotianae INRA-310]